MNLIVVSHSKLKKKFKKEPLILSQKFVVFLRVSDNFSSFDEKKSIFFLNAIRKVIINLKRIDRKLQSHPTQKKSD